MDPFKTFSPEDVDFQNNLNSPAFKTPSYSALPPSLIYVQKLVEINQRAPWLTPETMLTLAKAGASTEAIDRVGQFAGQRQVDTYDQRVSQTGELPGPIRWAYNGIALAAKGTKGVYNAIVPAPAKALLGDVGGSAGQTLGATFSYVAPVLKPTSRWGVAALDIIPETIQNLGSMILGQSSYDVGGLWASTSIATMLDAKEQGIDMGSGYFMAERVRQEQARRARLFRGVTEGGAGFTIGRGAAGTIFTEGGEAYNYASGIIDAAITLFSPDPTFKLAKAGRATAAGIGALRTGEKFAAGFKAGGGIRGIVPMLSSSDAVQLRRNFSAAQQAEAGLVRDLTGGSVRGDKFIRFMQKSAVGKNLVETLIEATSPARIQDEIFQYEISNDAAIKLAAATNEKEVISALTYGWTYGENALSANIGKYKVRRTPFVNGLRKSKYFTKLPRATIVVNGDKIQSADAIKNSVYTLRGASVPEEDIVKWLDGTPATKDQPKVMGAIEAYTQNLGSPVTRNQSLLAFNRLIALTLKANGVEQPIIEAVIKHASDHIDRIKTFFNDRSGLPTDNGHLAMQAELNRGQFPEDFWNEWMNGLGEYGDDLEFAQPMQIVEMLNRVQVLPDIRKLRRLTRNRLFAGLMPKDEKGIAIFKKLALTSKKAKYELTRITDEGAWKAADDEYTRLTSLEGPARTAANERIDELDDIKKSLEEKYVDKIITGDQRQLLSYIEYLQNRIWKPLNLATFGYILRNGFDAQMRMAFGGVNNLSHPLDYINLVLGGKYGKDIRGLDITGLGLKKGFKGAGDEGEIDEALQGPEGYVRRQGNKDADHKTRVYQSLREQLSYAADRIGWTASDSYAKGVKTGSFPVHSRNDGSGDYPSQRHTDGIVQAGQKTIADPLQSIAARGLSAGKDDEQIIDEILEYLEDTRSETYRTLAATYLDGINYWDNGRLLKGLPVNFREIRRTDPDAYVRQLREHARTIVLANVKKNTGGIDEVLFMFAHDRVPFRNLKGTVNRPIEDFPPINDAPVKIGDLRTIVDPSGKKIEGIINNISAGPDGAIATFVPVSPNVALSKGAKRGATGDRDARRLIESAPIYSEQTGKGLPARITREQKYWSNIKDPEFDAMQIPAVAWLFDVLNDTSVRVLEKSPTFRTFYYRTIGEHIDQLSAEEGLKLYEDILAKAEAEKQTIGQYLGEDAWFKITGTKRSLNITKKIEELPTRTNVTGTLTVEELDDFSRFRGLEETKNLLYDASNRNNFGDAMRVVIPFARAWADVMGRWLTFSATHNVQVARAGQRVYTGLTNADPDQDGRGIFFRDPQSGQLMFSFPLTGGLSKLLTGVDAPLAGPVARLSGGMSIYPALGPWGQYAVSKLIPDVPDYREFRALLMPYGQKSFGKTLSPLPGYLEKFAGAMKQDTEDLTSVYGQTYIETLRALSTNPNYDLSKSEDVVRLKADAKYRARILTIMRAFSQYTGPTAGTLEFKVPTKEGDMYVSELMKELQSFQDEDYDTAVPRFLKLYGDELMLYATSKSEATQKGLETSVEFDDWTRLNEDLVAEYPNLATYFAPKGSDFEFAVWDRQKRLGMRRPLNDQELIDMAQNRLGATKYRAARRLFGAFPTEEQSEKLRNYRIFLNERLPGFPVNVEFTVNQLKNDLITLRKMTKDERLKDNPTTQTIVAYLDAHDQAMAAAGGKSLQSKKATPIRAQLYLFGEALASSNPEFDRIWTRLLASEVEE